MKNLKILETLLLEKSEITEKNLLQLMTGKDQSKDVAKQEAHKTSHSQVALRTQKMRVWADSKESNFINTDYIL